MPFLKSWKQKKGYCTCPPALNTTRGWANHLSYPSSLTPGHTPTLTPYKKRAHTHPLGSKREPVMLPTAARRSPSKALCEFLVWPLVNFYWLGKAKNHTDNCEFKPLHLVSTYHPKVHFSHLLFHVWGSLLIGRSLATPIALDIFTYIWSESQAQCLKPLPAWPPFSSCSGSKPILQL